MALLCEDLLRHPQNLLTTAPGLSRSHPTLFLPAPNSHLAQPPTSASALGQTLLAPFPRIYNELFLSSGPDRLVNNLVLPRHTTVWGWEGPLLAQGGISGKKGSGNTGLPWPESPTHLARPPHPSLFQGLGSYFLIGTRE